ncbi:MAG: hypothetical protein J5881_04035 [Clostridia bacterium]|nr:hypothetical protein [Clostridia bacterium]
MHHRLKDIVRNAIAAFLVVTTCVSATALTMSGREEEDYVLPEVTTPHSEQAEEPEEVKIPTGYDADVSKPESGPILKSTDGIIPEPMGDESLYWDRTLELNQFSI